MAAEIYLTQLPTLLEDPNVDFQPSPFFTKQFTAFEVWLDHGSEHKKPPEQLPIVLQVWLFAWFYLVNVIGFVHLCFWDDSSIWVGTIPRYGSLGRTSGLVCWNISICSKVCCKLLHRSYGRFLCLYGLRSSHLIRFIFEVLTICWIPLDQSVTLYATAFLRSTSLSSMKHVRGSTWRKNSDEKRKILGHSIAADNIHEIMAVEVEC
ncbi:hypothetical protein RHGRI_025893 [Rhododendron griersonianum]|uniref:Uncharacterized protein n=1 Tax=Rhododendron griersonianum TaxID=479676 RepID=A0AAV6IRL8_9ERIC|nr:hypothetical protein RHGRI_025893 [Rhododendron griersonianum]